VLVSQIFVLGVTADGYAAFVFATASHRPSSAHTDEADARRRARIGFALSHPTVVVGLAMGADTTTGVVGAAILALHGLVELHWHLADRAEPAGIPVSSLYSGPS
jgi:acyl dehydratase